MGKAIIIHNYFFCYFKNIASKLRSPSNTCFIGSSLDQSLKCYFFLIKVVQKNPKTKNQKTKKKKKKKEKENGGGGREK